MDEIISYKMCAVKVRNAKLRNYLKRISRQGFSHWTVGYPGCQRFCIFRLIPHVFILREAKITSGGTGYKSLFHADVAVWELAKPVLYFVTFLNFRVCHTTKIALFRLFAAQNKCLQCLAAVCKILKISSPNM
jgi:hypothetical protein